MKTRLTVEITVKNKRPDDSRGAFAGCWFVGHPWWGWNMPKTNEGIRSRAGAIAVMMVEQGVLERPYGPWLPR